MRVLMVHVLTRLHYCKNRGRRGEWLGLEDEEEVEEEEEQNDDEVVLVEERDLDEDQTVRFVLVACRGLVFGIKLMLFLSFSFLF